MANLKRHLIELVKNPEEVAEGGVPEFEKHWTIPFIPFRKVIEAATLQERLEKGDLSEVKQIEEMANFIAELYKDIPNGDYLIDRLHAPDGMEELRGQIDFIVSGAQSEDESRVFLQEKNS